MDVWGGVPCTAATPTCTALCQGTALGLLEFRKGLTEVGF
jgi:hypothetical protein